MRKLTLTATATLAAMLASGTALAGKDLDSIKSRGALVCGVPTGTIASVPGTRSCQVKKGSAMCCSIPR